MVETYKIIDETEVDSKFLVNPDRNFKEEISFKEYLIRFDGIEEPNYGRLVMKFNLYKNGDDITKEINEGGSYCLPILFPFIDSSNNFIYIPTENKIVLINTNTDELFRIDYPEFNGLKYNFFFGDYLFVIFHNNYLIIDLKTLDQHLVNERIDFAIPFNNQFVIFKNNFQNFEKWNLENFQCERKQEFKIDSKALFSSTVDIYQKKYKKSQNGYLWSTGHKNIDASKKQFGIHIWGLAGFDLDRRTFDLGTTIPISEGIMDDKRCMWFDVKNKFIRIDLKAMEAKKV